MRVCGCGASRYEWANEEHTRVRCCECGLLYVAREPEYTYQEMRDNLFIRATELGCTPVWVNFRWECRCPGTVHGLSAINPQVSFSVLEKFAEVTR